MSEHSARHTARKKPAKCPDCGASPVASVLYGLPAMDEELDGKIEQGLVALGGCIVTGDDPQWRCVRCGAEIYRDGPHGIVE
jgi:DNA-directed RNA polymerase subunit RPC12/RpoP